jgi:hypothetical protein
MNRSLPLARSSARRVWLCLLGACALAAPAAGQVPDSAQLASDQETVYEVRLEDGSVLYGRIVAVAGTSVTMVTSGGVRIELQRAQIRAASPMRGTVRADGEIWPEDPNRTRLFFGPTGRALRAGEGYIGAFELFLPFVAVGLTDFLTIAGGTPIIPEAIGQVVYLAPRIQIVDTDRVQLSTGALAFFDLGDDADPGTLGILFGAGTFGSNDHALTAGAGWGFAGDEVSNRPAILFGGETRISRRVKLITENYYVSWDDDDGDSITLFGAGIRIFGERMTGDLGLGFGGGAADFACCIPLVNFVYNFGSGR